MRHFPPSLPSSFKSAFSSHSLIIMLQQLSATRPQRPIGQLAQSRESPSSSSPSSPPPFQYHPSLEHRFGLCGGTTPSTRSSSALSIIKGSISIRWAVAVKGPDIGLFLACIGGAEGPPALCPFLPSRANMGMFRASCRLDLLVFFFPSPPSFTRCFGTQQLF